MEELQVCGLRPDTDTADHMRLVARAEMDHCRRHAAEADELALQHVDGKAGGYSGVDRIAPRFQDLQPGKRGIVVTGYDDVSPGHEVRPSRAGGAEEIRRLGHRLSPAVCPYRPTATAAPIAGHPGAGSASAPTYGSPSSPCPLSAGHRRGAPPHPPAPPR